jgi:hypothetical protein
MLKRYIHNLIDNIPIKERKLDIILEGGGFNGCLELGVLLFLNELKKKHPTQIHRVSGCSVGSLMGFFFLTNQLDEMEAYYINIRNHLKKHHNVNITGKILREILEKIDDTTFEQIKNDKLYISFYNTEEKKYIVEHRYTSKEHLGKTILKSCHFPFFMDGKCLLDNKFVDGFVPFIFPEREKTDPTDILYVTINRFSQLKGFFNTHNEKNHCGRELEGVLDCYNFLLYEKPTKMCSYVHQWSYFDFVKLRIKQFLTLVLIYILHYSVQLKEYIHPLLMNFELYQRIIPITYSLMQDTILYFCF